MINKPPTNYTGSKHLIIEELIKYFPKKDEIRCFYDVFCGGLSVSINTPYKNYVANDIITPLINFYRHLKTAADGDINGRESINNEIERILSYKINKNSKEDYNRIRTEFNNTGGDNPYLFFSLVSSCMSNLMRFNKKMEFNQSFGKRTINNSTVEKIRNYCLVLKEKNIMFTNLHYKEFFETLGATKDDFIYLDPPYTISEAGYNAVFSKSDEDGLYDILDDLNYRKIKFAFSNVSIHKGVENPYMNRLSKYKIIELTQSYEKVANKKGLESQEILVINY